VVSLSGIVLVLTFSLTLSPAESPPTRSSRTAASSRLEALELEEPRMSSCLCLVARVRTACAPRWPEMLGPVPRPARPPVAFPPILGFEPPGPSIQPFGSRGRTRRRAPRRSNESRPPCRRPRRRRGVLTRAGSNRSARSQTSGRYRPPIFSLVDGDSALDVHSRAENGLRILLSLIRSLGARSHRAPGLWSEMGLRPCALFTGHFY